MSTDFNMPVNLDSEGIKENLIEYLKQNSDFEGYDFEGSTLNTLMDLLAQNTNILAHIAHIAINERDINHAQIRRSVVAEAKKIGYIPHSKTAAKVNCSIVVTPSDTNSAPASISINKGDIFVSAKDEEIFYFVATKKYQTTLFNDVYTFSDVELLQGEYRTNSYEITENGEKIIIKNPNVDTSTLRVIVKDSKNSSINNLYVAKNSLAGLDEDSKAYFVSENKDGHYQIEFGNGKVGKQVKKGNYVEIEFIASKGVEGNGCWKFNSVSAIGGYNNIAINPTSKSYGGSERESISDIKYIAPKYYMTANRAVTASDYDAIIRRNLYGVDDVRSWGGEDNIPPVYGSVFISIKMQDGQELSDIVKNYIKREILKRYNMLTVEPIIVDPQDVELGIDVVVSVDHSKLDIDDGLLIDLIKEKSVDYGQLNLGKFSSKFRTSKYLNEIDLLHNAITNSYIKGLTLTKTPYVENGKPQSLSINFTRNVIKKGSVLIDGFRVLDTTTTQILGNIYYMQDDGKGSINIYRDDNGAQIRVRQGVGTVDYENGRIVVTQFTPVTTAKQNKIRAKIVADSQIINSFNDDVINISDDSNISVTIERE